MFIFNPKLDAKYLEELYGGDPEITQMMFNLFLTDSIPSWEKVEGLIRDGQFAPAGELVHKIKPSFSMSGLTALHPQVQELEKSLKSGGEYNALIALYEDINGQLYDLKAIIQEDIDRLNQII
ncbi:HPt (histidine-containing phosphotransfer) domain-containing protein [Pseudarcicella hirudinis]|uniref:HPt (Histidine-containing phosphotransfer) domain-containing protein n=1 Tax=Pseudarcicella hirudinis TaxID=1079859 RepID=A0A1I5WBS3_9BACT|nr:Hpt domain-containing protein [Pseudarcicella hirudinis]SFQ17121.1 HPt (histidine-containing phosphotransfer) domain-containing protein [Pseudarcicella hirudinis]